MALEQLGDCRLAHTARLLRRRSGFPEFEQPLGAEVVFQCEQGREVAPELLTQAIGEAVPFNAEVLGDARPFAQLDDDRIGCGEEAEATRIGAQAGGHDLGVAAVILGAGHGETVAKPVHLLRVDGVDLEAALDQRLDYRPVRDFDGDMDLTGVSSAARRHQPGGHLGQSLSAVFEDFLADLALVAVGQEHAVALASPIDAGIPSSLIAHRPSPGSSSSRRNPRRSLYWRSGCGLRIRRGLPTGRRSRPIRRGTGPIKVVKPQGGMGRSRRIGSVRGGYADSGRRPPVTLRSARRHFARPAASIQEPRDKGTGWVTQVLAAKAADSVDYAFPTIPPAT